MNCSLSICTVDLHGKFKESLLQEEVEKTVYT